MPRRIPLVLIAATAACSGSHEPPADAGSGLDSDRMPDAFTWDPRCEEPVPGRGPAVCSEPCTSEPVWLGPPTVRRDNCCNPNPPELARVSWWVGSPPPVTECLERPRETPAGTQPQYGDRCNANAASFNDLECGMAPQVVCREIITARDPAPPRWDPLLREYWIEGFFTTTCRTSSDCPDGTVCVDRSGGALIAPLAPEEMARSPAGGECREACDPTEPDRCIQCRWYCDPQGYCSQTGYWLPLGPACAADCECPRPWNMCVRREDGGGRCGITGGLLGLTLSCGPGYPSNCACTGGTCESGDHWDYSCCRTPEGDIIERPEDPRRDAVCGAPPP